MPRKLHVILAILLLVCTILPLQFIGADAPLDFDVANGRFYKQANGQGGIGDTGFAVTDRDGMPFWTWFARYGGVNALGYPISDRFVWKNFTVQAFQKVVMQWHPDTQSMTFVNTFDELSSAGKDNWLLSTKQVPPPANWASDVGLTWDQTVANHLALLNISPEIKAAYLSASDPISLNGLPMAAQDFGNVVVVRAQRKVFQQWKTNVPWATAGQVTVANGGDVGKEAGLYPADAITPKAYNANPSPTPAPQITSFSATPNTVTPGTRVTLSWGQVNNATSAVINNGIGGVPAPGHIDVYPTQTTTYWLTAVGRGGTTASSVTVNVNASPAPGPNIPNFTANPATINPGGSTTLQWSGITNASTITIDHGIGNVGASGSVTVQPGATTTYTLFASGNGGNSQKSVTVNVAGPVVVPVVRQVSPNNGQDFNVIPRIVTLTWQPVNVQGGVTYSVEVEHNLHGMWTSFASQSGIGGLSYTTPDFGEDSVARWRVWAVSPTAGAGPKSEWREFSITPDAHDFIGTWRNADTSLASPLKRMEISASGETLNVHLWGNCIPNECDLGTGSAPFDSEPFIVSIGNHHLQMYKVNRNTLHVVDTSDSKSYEFRK
jgi:hypothetical protein